MKPRVRGLRPQLPPFPPIEPSEAVDDGPERGSPRRDGVTNSHLDALAATPVLDVQRELTWKTTLALRDAVLRREPRLMSLPELIPMRLLYEERLRLRCVEDPTLAVEMRERQLKRKQSRIAGLTRTIDEESGRLEETDADIAKVVEGSARWYSPARWSRRARNAALKEVRWRSDVAERRRETILTATEIREVVSGIVPMALPVAGPDERAAAARQLAELEPIIAEQELARGVLMASQVAHERTLLGTLPLPLTVPTVSVDFGAAVPQLKMTGARNSGSDIAAVEEAAERTGIRPVIVAGMQYYRSPFAEYKRRGAVAGGAYEEAGEPPVDAALLPLWQRYLGQCVGLREAAGIPFYDDLQFRFARLTDTTDPALDLARSELSRTSKQWSPNYRIPTGPATERSPRSIGSVGHDTGSGVEQ